MKQTKEWVQRFLKTLNQKSPKIIKIFDDLVYGKSMSCIFEKKEQMAIIYLNEDIPQILVAVINQQQIYFNLCELKILVSDPRHQLELKLQSGKYIILQQQKDEVVLIFKPKNASQNNKMAQQKQSFLQFMKFYLQQLAKAPFQTESLLLHAFMSIDKNKNMTLQKSQIDILMGKLKIKESEQLQAISNYVRKQEDSNLGEITFVEFQRIMKLLQCRIEFKPIYQKYSQKKIKSLKYYMQKNLQVNEFIRFLKEQQYQQDQRFIKNVKDNFSKQQKISFYEFSKFMVSSQTAIHCDKIQDLQIQTNHPLTHYFCFSSHNTYLTGNQLTSDSSAMRYRQDLQNGYRCLQIDVHNGSKEPIVKHGFTMTSSVTFQQVIRTISNYSKQNPKHSPIILSLENHTTKDQQLKVVSILKDYFGDKIFKILPYISSKTYPTLEQTIGKIIIKNPGNFFQYQKSISQQLLKQGPFIGQQPSEEQAQNPSGICYIDQEYPADIQQHMKQFNTLIIDLENWKKEFIKSHTAIKKRTISRQLSISKLQVKLKRNILPQMLEITGILGSGNLKNPVIWESNSLGEGTVKTQFITNPKFLKQWTENYWIRSYPSASRVDSSNYNPICNQFINEASLQLGIQLVALNSQSSDYWNRAMNLFFRKNKKNITGYRLKIQENSQKLKQLNISPISGFMISSILNPDEIPDVRVNMQFCGCTYDMLQNQIHSKMESYTSFVKGNSFSPVFHNSRVMHLKISKPSLAFIFLQIQNCGKAVISIEAIKKGYRSVQLLDNNLKQRKCKIILKIE